MSAITEEERREFAKALHRFTSKADALLDGDLRNNSGNQSVNRITFEAGGAGVWIATTACLVMLAAMLVGGFWLSREFARVDKELNERKEEGQRMQSYLSAIYIQAPQLQPKDEKQNADR